MVLASSRELRLPSGENRRTRLGIPLPTIRLNSSTECSGQPFRRHTQLPASARSWMVSSSVPSRSKITCWYMRVSSPVFPCILPIFYQTFTGSHKCHSDRKARQLPRLFYGSFPASPPLTAGRAPSPGLSAARSPGIPPPLPAPPPGGSRRSPSPGCGRRR